MSLNNPAYVQTSYQRTLSDGLPGTDVDDNPTYNASFIAENGDIGLGKVISMGVLNPGTKPVHARIGNTGGAVATAGYAVSAGVVDQTISDWTAINNGEFQLQVNGATAVAVGPIDFTSGATTMDLIAGKIQTALRAAGGSTQYTSATVTYDATMRAFTITSGTTGASSSITYIGPVDGGTGTEINAMMGMDAVEYVLGQASTSIVILGVTLRSMTEEGGAGTLSNTTTVKEGHVGAFRYDGKVKVLSTEAAVAGGDVYFVDATGDIVSAGGAGRSQLATAVFVNSANAGTCVNIDITGIRG